MNYSQKCYACYAHDVSLNFAKPRFSILNDIFTAHACGKVMFSYCLCVSVCVSVWAITFEFLAIETSFLVWWYIVTISRSRLSIKVIGSRSRSPVKLASWTVGHEIGLLKPAYGNDVVNKVKVIS